MSSFGERAEATMFGLAALAASGVSEALRREDQRQREVAAARARNAAAATRAYAAVDRAECDKLRARLIAARVLIVDLQRAVDAAEGVYVVRKVTPTTEVTEVELRTALIYANAEISGLREDLDDLADESV